MAEDDESPQPDPNWEVRGEVVEFYGYFYDMTGVGVGTDWEFWGAKCLPRVQNASASDINGGESLPTREKCLQRIERESWWRYIAQQVDRRHPPLYGPLRFSTEPVFEQLESGYQRVIWFGAEARLQVHRGDLKELAKPKPKFVLSAPGYPARSADAGLPKDVALHRARGTCLMRLVDSETIRLLGTAPANTDCWSCDPGPAWGAHKQRKIRVGLTGRPDVEGVLCLHHLKGYVIPYEEQRRGWDVFDCSWQKWEPEVDDLVYADAQAAEEGRELPGARRLWQERLEEVAADRVGRIEVAMGAHRNPTPIGAGVELSRDQRTAHYKGRSFRVVRLAGEFTAYDGGTSLCGYVGKAAMARAIRDHVDGPKQGQMPETKAS